MPGRILMGILAALCLAGCGTALDDSVATNLGPSGGDLAATQATAPAADPGNAMAGGGTNGASHWTLADISRAEHNIVRSETQNGNATLLPMLSMPQLYLLHDLTRRPPGTLVQSSEVTADFNDRIAMEAAFDYGLDTTYHVTIFRFDDLEGRTLGYRVQAQPQDLLSGKSIVLFYGPDTGLLNAQPQWD